MPAMNRKNGFILLLAIAMIPLVGVVLAVLAANSKILTLYTRREVLRADAENAALSGLAWVRKNPQEAKSLAPGEPMLLTIADGTARQVRCRIELDRSTAEGAVLYIIGHAEDNRFSVDEERRVILP